MKVDTNKKAGLSIDYSLSATGATLDDISEEKLAKYSKKTIDNACRLKAKYGTKYSDEYYLDYSSRNTYINMVEHLGEPQRARASMCAVQDPNWQGYSYEEIIQMENNGVKIPQEVLLWAHSQQESDIVSYEVIESEALNDDNTSTGEISDSSDINALLKNAQIYTVKSTSAQKTAEEDAQKYSELSTQAKKIQAENKNTYKDELDKISKLTKEWKQLDTKNKNGTLNVSEKTKYNELSKTINSESTTSNKKEVAFNERELDELLSSMSGLSEKTTENTKTANETIQASEALSNKIKTYNTNQQKYNTQGVVDSGSLDNPITGTNAFSIEAVSMEAGKNLETQTNETDATLTEESNLEVKEFAKEYSRNAQEAVKSTNNSTKADNEADTTTSETDTQTQTEDSEQEKSKTFTVIPRAGVVPSITATATTILSMTDLLTSQTNVGGIHDSLIQAQEKTTKMAKSVQKEEKKTETEHNSNEKKIEAKEKELEETKKQKEEQVKSSSEQITQDAENENNTNAPDTDNKTPKSPVIDEGDAEQEAIANEIVTVANADEKLKGTANAQNMKLKQSVSSNDKVTETLDKQNKALDKRNDNAKTVAANTILTGVMTVADGTLNISVGTPMTASGNPVTVAKGVKLVNEGVQETVAGTGAIVTGGVSLGTSIAVDESVRTFKDATKAAKLTNKLQTKQVKETTDNLREMGILEVSGSVQDVTSGGSTSPENPAKTVATSTTKAVKEPEKQEQPTQVTENIEQQPQDTTTTQESEISNDNPQPAEQAQPSAQTSQSKVVTDSQVEEKPLSDDEKITIIKENYSDEEIEARISDDEENDDSNIIAAASINASANIVKTTNTDDKLARKLSRFNNDSIIESRKKMKKVQAVSASSGKKA